MANEKKVVTGLGKPEIHRVLIRGYDLTKDLVNGDTHTGWLGPDIHFLAASIKGGKEFSWVFTHKDERDVDEGWSEPGNHEDACKILEGWAPAVHAIVRMTPPNKLVDWKLVYRDPLPTWVSPKHRIATDKAQRGLSPCLGEEQDRWVPGRGGRDERRAQDEGC